MTEDKMIKVEVIADFEDRVADNRHRKVGEIFEVDQARAKVLLGDNPLQRGFIKIVQEDDETPASESDSETISDEKDGHVDEDDLETTAHESEEAKEEAAMTVESLKKLTLPKLQALATEKGIKFGSKTSKAELIADLLA